MREKYYGQKMWLAAVDGLLDQADMQLNAPATLETFLGHATPGEKLALEKFVKAHGLPALETALNGYRSILRLKAEGLKADISREEKA
ncbi:hypothetical protein E3E11_03465 [Oecophyllibacter saccharovorans]|uniref:hypothetical protein n=1 Tax=Oecophyllibacter saccharovorans TaxID=2558360 RepID=UPI0011418A54|nr:hypothetical protein [Oecophyllibacter saccharovorans]QDH15083.1 hypothetical protein E3E11_03465 [Oecophyllibacter saccharovorans]